MSRGVNPGESTWFSATAQILARSLGTIVLVRLKGGREIRGVLKSFDQHMNLLIDEAEEIRRDRVRKLGCILLRGDNVVFVSPVQA